MASVEEIKRDVFTACQILAREGLVNAFGHVSARVPGSERIVISPRMGLLLARSEDLVLITGQGERIEGGRPPLETPLHTAIYAARPDVAGIARTHSPYAIAFGSAGKPIRPVHNFGSVFPDGVPVYPNSELVRSPTIGAAVATALGKRGGLLLRGNGTVVVGRGVREAAVKAYLLEEAAATLYRSLQIGRPLYYALSEAKKRGGGEVLTDESELLRVWNFLVGKHRLSG